MNSSRRISFSVPVWVLVLSVMLALACTSSATDLVPDQQAEPVEEKQGEQENTESEPTASTAALSSKPEPQPDAAELSVGGKVGDVAPDFVGFANWINSEPLSIKDLWGKVVLVDVWTYTCVNCIRSFPFLTLLLFFFPPPSSSLSPSSLSSLPPSPVYELPYIMINSV